MTNPHYSSKDVNFGQDMWFEWREGWPLWLTQTGTFTCPRCPLTHTTSPGCVSNSKAPQSSGQVFPTPQEQLVLVSLLFLCCILLRFQLNKVADKKCLEATKL